MGVDLKKLGNPAEIQAAIDAELQRRGLAAYVSSVRYVPQGAPPSPDATHELSLRSRRTGEAITVEITAVGLYGVLADAVLAIL